jgi:hypothetical protein
MPLTKASYSMIAGAPVNVLDFGADYSAEDAKVQAIAASIHTPEVIAAYVAAQEVAQPE